MTDSVRSLAGLLTGQAVALGMSLAFLVVPGTGIFLDAYGPQRLPYVYLGVAGAGVVISWALARLERRLGLGPSAVAVTLSIALATGICWVGLAAGELTWLSAVVLVLFALLLQLGFVFIGGQAGRAFDVQQVKRYFPRIVAGFVFGFMVGGALAGPILTIVDRAEHVLLVGLATIGALAALILITTGRLPAPVEPPSPAGSDPGGRRPPLRHLLAVPLVGSVFAYQVLSAMGTQLVEYLLYDQAAQRYGDASELASFVGRFTALLNLTDLVALLLVGGLLMTRYGLRFGLGANPVVVTGLVAAALVVSATGGVYATSMFVLAGLARITDLTMADLATRTSVNATFQALPPRDRVTAQVAVEGAGVPLALGLTAALLLGLNAISGGSAQWVVAATAGVCLAWCLVALVVYRRYREAVVESVTSQLLVAGELDVSEPTARRVLLDLAITGTDAEASVAVRLLAQAGVAETSTVLDQIAESGDRERRLAVLDELVDAGHRSAPAVALEAAASAPGRERRRGLRALGRLPAIDGDDQISGQAHRLLAEVAAEIGDPDRAVALGSLLSLEADLQTESATSAVATLAHSSDAGDRQLAAEAVAAAGGGLDPDAIAELLGDPVIEVRLAALDAVAVMADRDRAAVFDLLRAPSGDDVEGGASLVQGLRHCRGAVGPATIECVLGLTSDRSLDVRRGAVGFLLAANWRTTEDDERVAALLADEVGRIERGADRHAALHSGPGEPAAESTARLRAALVQEAIEARRHLVQTIGLVLGHDLATSVTRAITDPSRGGAALAVEALDVSLGAELRPIVLGALRRLTEMESGEPTGTASSDAETGDVDDGLAAVADVIADPGWAAHPDWLQSCALAVALDVGRSDLVAGAEPSGPISAELADRQPA